MKDTIHTIKDSVWIGWRFPALLLAILCLYLFSCSGVQAQAMPIPGPENEIQLHETFSGNLAYIVIGNTESRSGTREDCSQLESSSSNLNLIANSEIKGAYLYWSGSGQDIDPQVTLNGTAVDAANTYQVTMEDAAWFGAFADVTDLVTERGFYEVEDLDWDNGDPYCANNNAYGGWAMVVIYENSLLTSYNVNVYNGFVPNPLPGTLEFDLDGILDTACAPSTFVTHVTWDGDEYISEDFSINNIAIGDNRHNGSTSANLDIDTYKNIRLQPGQSSISYRVRTFFDQTELGRDAEFAIHQAMVIKTVACGDTIDLDNDGLRHRWGWPHRWYRSQSDQH